MDKIEIPFGAYDSETLGWTYTIPKDYTAKIEDGKIIVKKEESEDERIRNGLLHHFKNKMKPYWNELAVKDIVSYLEKQKEPENVSATTMAPSCWEVEQKEQKPPIAGNDFGWIDELKHDPEHPEELDQKVDDVLKQRKGIRALEWSKEDERLCNLIAKCIALGRKQGLVNDDDNIACLDLLMRKGTSWSRGDEKMLKLIISELEQEGKDVNAPELYKIEIDWLKSLRPQAKQEWDTHDKAIVNCIVCCLDGQFVPEVARKQALEWFNKHRRDFLNNPSWKPSEEQMSALNYFIKLWGNSDDQLEYTKIFNTVKSLRDDLEKQM